MIVNENTCVMCGNPEILPEGTIYCEACKQKMSDSVLKYVFKIKLNTFLDVKNFVNLVSKHSGDVVIKSERWIVDGKSIMGLYSLDLSKRLEVEFYGDMSNDVKKGLKKYISIDIQYT